METNVNYTLVGAFVISLVAAIVLSIIWLSSGLSAHHEYSYYTVYMQESVSGLNVDSDVEYNGVKVGTVQSIQLDSNDPHLVDLLIKIRSDTPITRGTRATLTTRGITGITFIALKDKSDDMRPLVAEKGQKYPVIPTTPSIFLRLDIVLTNLSSQIQKVSDAIEGLLDKENQASIKATLSNLREITGTLSENNEKMSAILVNTARASARLGPLILSTQGTMLMLQNQTLPQTYRLLENLNETARNLSIVSSQMKQNPSVIIRGVQPRTLGPGEHR
jgi:phospholipid/cholesterol/gamma-HCH transport system substrate-binding protein